MLAEGIDPFIDETGLANLEPFQRAVSRLLHDPSFLGSLDPPNELGVGADGQLFAGSDVSVSLYALHRLDGYPDRRAADLSRTGRVEHGVRAWHA
jgi:hypothetical protein